jgi:hypothetical protein
MSNPSRHALDPVASAEFLGTSVNYLKNMRRMGTGPAFFRRNRSIFYEKADLEAHKAARDRVTRHKSTAEYCPRPDNSNQK